MWLSLDPLPLHTLVEAAVGGRAGRVAGPLTVPAVKDSEPSYPCVSLFTRGSAGAPGSRLPHKRRLGSGHPSPSLLLVTTLSVQGDSSSLPPVSLPPASPGGQMPCRGSSLPLRQCPRHDPRVDTGVQPPPPCPAPCGLRFPEEVVFSLASRFPHTLSLYRGQTR